MDKNVSELSRSPFAVSLAGCECSIFVDPEDGNILINEGDGLAGQGDDSGDWMNGAVLYPDQSPRFVFEPAEVGSSGGSLVLCSGTFRHTVGRTRPDQDAWRWAADANAYLAKFAPPPGLGKPGSSAIKAGAVRVAVGIGASLEQTTDWWLEPVLTLIGKKTIPLVAAAGAAVFHATPFTVVLAVGIAVAVLAAWDLPKDIRLIRNRVVNKTVA